MTYNMPAPGARFRLSSRRLTLFVGAAAIALAGLAAATRPAKADAEDLLRFLAGAIIVGVIVNAIDDRHTPRYIDRWVLPNSCLESIRVNHRNIQVYNSRCLSRGGYNNLPNHCQRSFQVNGHRRNGYVAECLWESGYQRENGYFNHPGFGDHPPLYSSPPRYYPEPPRHLPPNTGVHNMRLPRHCAMTYRRNGHREDGYWASCLRDAGFYNLPRSCRLRTRGGDHVYDGQCLRNAGYRQGR